jgi:hypothetical protein
MKTTKTTRSSVKADFRPVRAARAAGRLFERKRPLGRSEPRGRKPEALEYKRQRDRDPEVRARRKAAKKKERQLGGSELRDMIAEASVHPANNRFTAERKSQFLEGGIWDRQKPRRLSYRNF